MAEGGREAREEWSWSDSDGEGGDPLDDKSLESAVRKSSQGVANGAGVESGPNFVIHSFAGESKRTVKNEVQQMVAVGLCSVQAADMFMQLVDDGLVGRPSDQRSKLGSTQDQLAATEARLAASERALRESEEQQLRLQADLMKMTLSPYHDGGGVTAFDVARAQREAEKVLTLQRKIAESEERERQQAVMQAKMEELLRLQEVALTEREENSAQLEQEMSATEAKMRLLSEQLSQMEQTLAMEQQRNQVLEDGIVQRDEQLRRTDAEKLRLHEIQIEEKENQLRNLEARLEANGGDKIDNLKETFNHTLEERDQRVTALENELRKVKAERDESRKSLAEVRHLYTSMQSTCRELYMESEHLQMALTIVEPKVHVLQAMFSDIALQVQGQLNGRDNELAHANRMHVKMEEMDQALGQRDRQIESMKNELESLQCILKERESKIPELQEALEKQRQIVAKQNEDSLMKDQRIETLSSALEQMQYALDRTQHTMSEREARVQLLQSSLDNSQPAMSIARKAIEERDTKINALNMLLNMAESQVQEMGKALNEAKLDLKEKDDRLKVLQGRVVELETSVTGWRGELAEKDWQINAHESKISDLQGKLHSIDQDAASESGHNASSPPKILNDSVSGQGLEDCDCVQTQQCGEQVGSLSFAAYRSLNFGQPRDVQGRVVRAVPPLADQDLQNVAHLSGNIALIERGLVTFQEKAQRAFSAGAIGIVFINSQDEAYQPCIASAQPEDSTPIPMLCIKQSDGKLLTDGMTVHMKFSNEFGRPDQGAFVSPELSAARQRVLAGEQLQLWTRGKLTGSYVEGRAFVQVTNSAEVLLNDRYHRILRVMDGFSKALNLVKPGEGTSQRGFTVRVEGHERFSEVNDLELMASSEQDKKQWIAGILEVLKEQNTLVPKYRGQQHDGMPKGAGLGEYANGDQYMGEWESNTLHPTQCIVPLPSGKGVFAWRNGDLYRGEWLQGNRTGFGTLETSDGAIYQGEWQDDRKSGAGIQMTANKERYVGSFFDGFPHGLGVVTQQDGTKMTVEYSVGTELKKGPYPHPNEATQKRLVESSIMAREAAKNAAEKAAAAQALCRSAETHINQAPLPISNFSHPTASNIVNSSVPSTPGVLPAAFAGVDSHQQISQSHLLASPFSPITNTPQTPQTGVSLTNPPFKG